MTQFNRRHFLKAIGAGAALGALPASIRRALAIPANNATGTLADVKHIVMIMQENRSFDHYYGTMPGVRGFSDRFTIPTANGSIWTQTGVGGKPVQPYHLDPSLGDAYVVGGDHSWQSMHAAWNAGLMSAWPQAKKNDASMGYLDAGELPYYRALAGAFTICDAYHCSVLGPTYPNRLFWQSGSNGVSLGQGAVIATETFWTLTGGTPEQGLTWTTYAESLQAAGVSWKVYEYGKNTTGGSLNAAFRAYRQANADLAAQGSPVAQYSSALEALSPLYKGYGNTMSTDQGFLADMAADIAAGTLPQVSWVIAPEPYQEHPAVSAAPQGEWYVEQLLDVLTANPEVWSQTVLLINYDENDCFFDHMPPPCPPSPDAGTGGYHGGSTVSTDGEYLTMGSFPGETSPFGPDGNVVGAGMRVPMLVVSPWSVGGWVNSQVFDHTSPLQFINRVFGVAPSNITPWRQAVMGDMTSCFNFASPNATLPTLVAAPTRAAADAVYKQQRVAAQVPVPALGSVPLPVQPLAGLVPSRALPYNLHTSAVVDPTGGVVTLELSNTGTQAAVFHVYDKLNLTTPPRRYTVEAGKQLSDAWNAAANTPSREYSLWVLGPNGFNRHFDGNVQAVTQGANPEVRVCYDHANNQLQLTVTNTGTEAAGFAITAQAYRGDGPWSGTVAPGQQAEWSWSLDASHGWYDFTLASADGKFARGFAGRLETGKDSYCDPAMGVVVSTTTG
ncbi:phosphocholine-specific phospholipase C [Burkholderia sp. 22PA0106]|uniref:phosphocholine-specific phospholipase C n=1 Tax=Burkholderia sp. 22PA0106 TaxID=3237371 RepID=UPI0039C1BC62